MPESKANAYLELATLAGGCFWCLEAVYQDVLGVQNVVSGYAGGNIPNPTYAQVCSGTTGHAEAVQLTYTPDTISYRDLLEIFFSIHDPTTLNRQGNDIGTQYRSAIFTHDESQRITAEQVIAEYEKSGIFKEPIVTVVAPLDAFCPAEENHQNYYKNNPSQGYCRLVIAPKVAKFRKKFSNRLNLS